MAVYAALLDACVLVPISLADILLRTAERQLYRPAWSNRILEEVQRAIARIHPELDAALIQRRLLLMSQSFPGALIEGFDAIERGLELPDPDDTHVLAAAVRGHCQAIVTHNLKDFPAGALDVFDVEAISPDEFLLNQLDLAPRPVLDCLHEQAAAAQHPSLSVEEVLVSIGRAGAPNFADEVLRRL